MNGSYLAVVGRIRRELDALQAVVDRTRHIWEQHQQSAGDYHVDAAALNLHGFYAGLERIFEVIARQIDQTAPTGASWHQELLEQMNTALPSIRPAVLTPDARNRLDPYRGFRHVVRNVYTMHFDTEQVGRLVKRLPATLEQVARELHAFADTLEQIAHDR